MKFKTFITITTDIERHIEGEPYELHFCLNSGEFCTGSWEFLNREESDDIVLIVSQVDRGVNYVPLAAVEYVQLST